MIVMEDHPTSSAAVQLSRQQILSATSRCLAHEGYDATTIRRIAARLDCAVGSIYRYFRDKRDLLDAVAQSSLEPVAQMLKDGGSLDDSACLYHDLASGDLAMYRLMFWIDAVGSDSVRMSNVPDVIAQIIEGWTQLAGDESAARRCWMLLHGCVTLGMDKQTMLDLLHGEVQPSAPVNVTPSPPAASRTHRRAPQRTLTPIVVTKSPDDLAASSSSIAVMHDALVDEEPVEDLLLL